MGDVTKHILKVPKEKYVALQLKKVEKVMASMLSLNSLLEAPLTLKEQHFL